MTGIEPVNNIYLNTLVFHGEGQTFSTPPLLAPGRVAAFEATNLRTFRRTAAFMGGHTENEEIRLKFSLDPATGKLVVVGGESKADLVKDKKSQHIQNNISSSPVHPPGILNSFSNDSYESISQDNNNTTESQTNKAIHKLEEVRNSINQRLKKIKLKLANSEKYEPIHSTNTTKQSNNANTNNNDIQQEEIRLEQKLKTVERVLARIENRKFYAQNDPVQKAATNVIIQSQKLMEKILKILHPSGGEQEGETKEQEKSGNKQGKQSMMRYFIDGPSIPIGLLINEAA